MRGARDCSDPDDAYDNLVSEVYESPMEAWELGLGAYDAPCKDPDCEVCGGGYNGREAQVDG